MEHTSIAFTNNMCTSGLILPSKFKNFRNLHPFCLFQYETKDKTQTILPDYYSISFTSNVIYNNKNREEILEFLSHCKWLQTAAFYGFHAGTVNQQIISSDNQQWYLHQKRICHCLQNGNTNCSIDILGPVYPGQLLQLQLCIPEAKKTFIVHVETHDKSLPSSACKIANQAELTYSVGNSSKTVNLTIVSDSYKECALFITAIKPDVYSFYDAFLVQLLPCPVGFAFDNGICDCDPILLNSIEKCYIDHSAIKCPAHTWITAYIQANYTKYLISDCPWTIVYHIRQILI